MLSSIILSMAMSVSQPITADIPTSNIAKNEVSDRRGSRRLNTQDTLNIQKVSDRRGSRRLNTQDTLNIQKVSDRRGSRRL